MGEETLVLETVISEQLMVSPSSPVGPFKMLAPSKHSELGNRQNNNNNNNNNNNIRKQRRAEEITK